MFVDSHVHVDDHKYDEDRVEMLERAQKAGVSLMLEICGGDIVNNSFEKGIELLDQYPYVYGAIGLHPHDSKVYDEKVEARLCKLSEHPKVIAWGEIGLDFYYDNSPRDIQRRVLIRQIELAKERNLPIILHIRDADEEMIDILRKHYHANSRAGIFHCFSGSLELALVGLELGFMISFSGNLTFKKSQNLRDIAAKIPLDRLLIETDCPYLSPEPHRGKRNEPGFVVEVAHKLAELHSLPLEKIACATKENFCSLFNIPSAS